MFLLVLHTYGDSPQRLQNICKAMAAVLNKGLNID